MVVEVVEVMEGVGVMLTECRYNILPARACSRSQARGNRLEYFYTGGEDRECFYSDKGWEYFYSGEGRE